jgi:NAD(P)-dependent dehydrogenase (short-subunit alcohol dehydrogenase family)
MNLVENCSCIFDTFAIFGSRAIGARASVASWGEPDRVDRFKNRIPVQRGGKAIELAEAILWLSSENSSYVTGTFEDPSGGL